MRKLLQIIPVLVLIVSCTNPSILQVSKDTYLLAREDHAGIFGSLSKLKAETIQDANDFAKSRKMVAVPVSLREKP